MTEEVYFVDGFAPYMILAASVLSILWGVVNAILVSIDSYALLVSGSALAWLGHRSLIIIFCSKSRSNPSTWMMLNQLRPLW